MSTPIDPNGVDIPPLSDVAFGAIMSSNLKPHRPRSAKRAAQITIRLQEDVKFAAQAAAKASRRSCSQWIEGLILDALAKPTKDE
jgi:hypothetical protein